MHLDDDEREQLDTQIEWLCSVANDCRRVTEDAMISECKVSEQYNKSPKGPILSYPLSFNYLFSSIYLSLHSNLLINSR